MSNSHSIKFTKIAIQGWRQFENIELELHDRLTIITGANGAGKSSLIRIFSSHFGYSKPFLSTPVADKSGTFSYLSGLFTSMVKNNWFKKNNFNNVGKIIYSNSIESALEIPNENGIQYNLTFQNMQNVPGIHIDSHQAVSAYQTITNIPAALFTVANAYQQYSQEVMVRYQNGYTGFSPLFRMKEAIIAMATFGEGNRRTTGNPKLVNALDGFVEVLLKILPSSLGFRDITVRQSEVVLQTNTGEFLLDAVSGGIGTLIDFAWRLHMFSIESPSFVVTIDEPENHLHPSMQRSLMRRLMEAFPQVQFIVATHSPFIISSVKDSTVYVLRYEESENRHMQGFSSESTKSRVISERLDAINKSASANQILREVLGVEATVPEWVSDDLNLIVNRYKNLELNVRTLIELREELKQRGYSDQYPVALSQLVAHTV